MEMQEIVNAVSEVETPVVYMFRDEPINDCRNLRVCDLEHVYKTMSNNGNFHH